MDLTKIKNLPFTVKDYKQMCMLLGEPIKGGNAKKSQLKEWERWLDLEKQGRSFTITRVYESPKEGKDGRSKGNHSKYIHLLEPIIIDYLATHDSACMTKGEWYKALGLYGEEWNGNSERERAELYKENPKFIAFMVNDFYYRTSAKVSSAFKSTVSSMVKRGLIEVSETLMVYEEKSGKFSGAWSKASEQDKERIADAESMALFDMGMIGIAQVMKQGLSEHFYTQVADFLSTTCEITRYCTLMRIDWVGYEECSVLSQERVNALRTALNDTLIDSLNSQAESVFKTRLAKYRCGDLAYEPAQDYVAVQRELTERLFRI